MTSASRKIVATAALVAASACLAACTESRLHQDAAFGLAVRQDVAAQIADPDARYRGTPAPGADGSRVGLAQTRYQSGTVLQPSAIATSTVSVGGGSGGGGGGGGGAK